MNASIELCTKGTSRISGGEITCAHYTQHSLAKSFAQLQSPSVLSPSLSKSRWNGQDVSSQWITAMCLITCSIAYWTLRRDPEVDHVRPQRCSKRKPMPLWYQPKKLKAVVAARNHYRPIVMKPSPVLKTVTETQQSDIQMLFTVKDHYN